MPNRVTESQDTMFLPVELILHIASYLEHIEDIRNCLTLSKEIRYLLLRTPKIMRRMKLVISKSRCAAHRLEFVNHSGSFIRCLRLNFVGRSDNTLKYILHHTPNLEVLDYENQNELYDHGLDAGLGCIGSHEGQVEVPKLNQLKLATSNFREFLKNIKNLTNLEVLSMNLKSLDDVADFLAVQQKLKKLEIKLKLTRSPIDCPLQGIAGSAKFHLKSLKFKFNHKSDEDFLKFFQTQAATLEELDVRASSEEFLDVLFKKAKKLTSLTFYGQNPVLYSDLYFHWTLDSVRKFTDFSSFGLNLALVYQKFPALESLKCSQLVDANGEFRNLVQLDLQTLFVDNFQTLKLPNLKMLSVKSLEKVADENSWTSFIQNLPCLESFRIYSLKSRTDHKIILKFIKNFVNLRLFELWYFVARAASSFTFDDPMPHNLLIDFGQKVIKSDDLMSINDLLLGQFEGFKFLSFSHSEVLFKFKNHYLRPFDADSD